MYIGSYALKLAIFIVHYKLRPETGHFYHTLEATPLNWPFLLFIRSYALKLVIFIVH